MSNFAHTHTTAAKLVVRMVINYMQEAKMKINVLFIYIHDDLLILLSLDTLSYLMIIINHRIKFMLHLS